MNIRESVNPAVAIAAIVGLVLIIAFIGFRVVAGANGSSNKPPEEAKKWLDPGKSAMMAHEQTRSGPGMGGPPPGAFGAGAPRSGMSSGMPAGMSNGMPAGTPHP